MKTAPITGLKFQDGAYLNEFTLKKGYKVHGLKRRASQLIRIGYTILPDDTDEDKIPKYKWAFPR